MLFKLQLVSWSTNEYVNLQSPPLATPVSLLFANGQKAPAHSYSGLITNPFFLLPPLHTLQFLSTTVLFTMASVDDYDFSSADAGASKVYNSEAGQIRVGGFMCIKDKPCKVSSVSTSKTGKHGHAKCNFTAIDIFTGKKYEDIIPATHNAHIPFVVRKEYDLVDISDDGFISCMDEEGEMREDVKLPTDPANYARELTQAFEKSQEDGKTLSISVLSAMGHEQVMSHKELQEGK